ncbi:MAG: GNAT family N-acetyltransferase [Solirubrobacteraceae bacterium]
MPANVSPVTDEVELHRRQRLSQRSFYRALADNSPGARTIDGEGRIQATIVPAAARLSLLNSVFYDDPAALLASLDLLADAYRRAGVDGYAVWVPAHDRAIARALRDSGHLRGGVVVISAGTLGELSLEPRTELELDPDPTPEMVAWCNDRAHGLQAPRSMAGALSTLDDPHTRAYAVRRHGELVCAGLVRYDGDHMYPWGLAVIPSARGCGLATELSRLTHREALAAGCRTVSSDVPPGGLGVGAKLGRRGIGRCDIWVRAGLAIGGS